MNMILNLKIGREIFFHIQDRNTRADLCKNSFYPSTIKNDNKTNAMRKKLQFKRNQQLH